MVPTGLGLMLLLHAVGHACLRLCTAASRASNDLRYRSRSWRNRSPSPCSSARVAFRRILRSCLHARSIKCRGDSSRRRLRWTTFRLPEAGAPWSGWRSAAAGGVSRSARVGIAVTRYGMPRALIASLICTAAVWLEVEVQAAFSVPEAETLAVRVAQGLHYGFGVDAAVPILLQSLLSIAWALVVGLSILCVESPRARP